MAAKIGLWIDHRQAVIISLTGKGADKTVIKSNAEKHIRAAGGSSLKGSFKSRLVPADDRREQEFTGHLKIYYNQIVEAVSAAESILIFGPGEAKKELKKQLEKNNSGGRIAGVETADEMTDNQILAKVCKFFNVPVPDDQNLAESPHQRMKT
ncbi:MAG: hypothetical protein K4571_03985 [Deltaproteobacteria bacterium]